MAGYAPSWELEWTSTNIFDKSSHCWCSEKSRLVFSAKARLVYQGRRLKDTVIKNERFSGFSLRFLWEIMGGAQPKIYGVKIWLTRQAGNKRVLVAAANLHKSGCPFDRLIVFNLLASKNDRRWIVCLSCVHGAIKRRLCHYGKCTRISLLLTFYIQGMVVVAGLHEWRSWFILKVIYWDDSQLNLWSGYNDSFTLEYRTSHSNSNANALELFCDEVLVNEDEFQIAVWEK